MMQGLLVLAAAGLMLFAGYSWGRAAGLEEAVGVQESLDAPRSPSAAQVVVPALLGLGCLAAAFLLQAEGGVRLLTPARLEEMQERAVRPASAGTAEPGQEDDPGGGVSTS